MRKKSENTVEAMKGQIASLSKEIICREKKTIELIRKEVALEEKLTFVLAKMIALEKKNVLNAEKTTKEKETVFKARIANLEKKQQKYEKRKEAAQHVGEKQIAIKKELEALDEKLKSDSEELFGIKKMADTGLVREESPFADEDAGKGRKRAAELSREIKETKKQQAKVKEIAEVTEELRKALEEEKEEPEEEKEEGFEGNEAEEQPEKEPEEEKPGITEGGEEPEGKEKPDESKGPLDWEKRQKELIGEAGEEKGSGLMGKDDRERLGNRLEEEEIPPEEENLDIASEPDEEQVLDREAAPEKGTKEYRDNEIALIYPDWQAGKENPQDSIIAVSQGLYEFEFAKTEAFDKKIQEFANEKISRMQSKPGSKLLIQKETSNNIFVEYTEEKGGRKILTKALFILHKNNIYSLLFSAPSDEFQKIDDLFLKTIFSVQTF
ncbi:MAG: hypothetical protein PHH08_03515 [Candidatus ainarchaeum sp.]|nr:hypothetical protein [Candidatus ainarchaeum sp.]